MARVPFAGPKTRPATIHRPSVRDPTGAGHRGVHRSVQQAAGRQAGTAGRFRQRNPQMVPRVYRSGGAGRQIGLSGAQLGSQVGTAADHQCCQVRSAECGYAGAEGALLEVFPDSAVDQVRQQHGLFRQVSSEG